MAGSPTDKVICPELHRFATDRELASVVSEKWLSELRRRNVEIPYHVALSGGRIANHFFNAIVQHCELSAASMEHVHFFWADERCVPPTVEASNFCVARELLFDPLGVSDYQIHRIEGELDGAAATEKAVSAVRRVVPMNDTGQPVFDMVFLGMGEDGHVASLFPNETAAAISDNAIYRLVSATKPPPIRITLGYGAIAASKQVWVLASGSGKEDALRKSLEDNHLTPLGRVLKSRTRTIIFTDIKC